MSDKRKSSISDETYQAILQKGLSVDPADFNRVRAYALVLLCIATGTRNKEIRLAEVNVIDTRAWTLDIIRVKGEASYGEEHVVPIREVIRPVVEMLNLTWGDDLVVRSVEDGKAVLRKATTPLYGIDIEQEEIERNLREYDARFPKDVSYEGLSEARRRELALEEYQRRRGRGRP